MNAKPILNFGKKPTTINLVPIFQVYKVNDKRTSKTRFFFVCLFFLDILQNWEKKWIVVHIGFKAKNFTQEIHRRKWMVLKVPVILFNNCGCKILIELVYILKTDCQCISFRSTKIVDSCRVFLLAFYSKPTKQSYKLKTKNISIHIT